MILPNIWEVIEAMFQTTNQVSISQPPQVMTITSPSLGHKGGAPVSGA